MVTLAEDYYSDHDPEHTLVRLDPSDSRTTLQAPNRGWSGVRPAPSAERPATRRRSM
jgi:hypothetical protein